MTHPEAVEAVAKVLYEVDAMTTDQWTAVHPDVQDAYRRDATAAVDVLVAAGWAPRAEVAMAIAADLLACTVCGQPHGYSRGRTGVQAPIQPGRWDLGADGHFFRPKYLADPRAAAAIAREHGGQR